MFQIVVSPEMYAHMTHHLSALSNGKIILILEGGYNLNAIALSMTLCTKALLGDPLPPLAPYKPPLASAMETIKEVMSKHARYWESLKAFNCRYPLDNDINVQCVEDGSTFLNVNEIDDLAFNLTDLAIDKNISTLSNPNSTINIDDDFVKDTEYVPLQFIPSATISSVNTISDQMKFNEPKSAQHVIDSNDYKKLQKESLSTSETINIPTGATSAQPIENLSLSVAQQQAISMPEFPVLFGNQNQVPALPSFDSNQLGQDYIPCQYGSYQESSGVYTFTKSKNSSVSPSKNTTTTDSKSNTKQTTIEDSNN